MLIAVTGINWGDEGKGRIVDELSEKAQFVVRYQGGNNAGHTVVTERGEFILNLLPSGILRPEVSCVLGTGMVVDLDHLYKEMKAICDKGIAISPEHLFLSDKATISMPWHVLQDELEENRLHQKGAAFGSTRRGIAYVYSDKYKKKTLRMGDLLHLESPSVKKRLEMILDAKNLELGQIYGQPPLEYEDLMKWCQKQAERFSDYICDTDQLLMKAVLQKKMILLEAQLGALRDIDYGIFPYTSSSNTVAGYAPVGAGIPGQTLDSVVGVMKAYSTCVGAGPFVAENAMDNIWLETLRQKGKEYGAATGRPRRVGPFDVPASRYGIQCQSADKIALTKLDVLSGLKEVPVITAYRLNGKITEMFSPMDDLENAEPVVKLLPGWKEDISKCRKWDELPEAARFYVQYLEKVLEQEIQFISVGPKRDQFIVKGEWL